MVPASSGSVVCMGSCMSQSFFFFFWSHSFISHHLVHTHTQSLRFTQMMLLSFRLRLQNPASTSSPDLAGSTPSCTRRQPKTGMKSRLCGHFSHLENQYSVVCLIALLLLNESLWRENSKCIVRLMGGNSWQMTGVLPKLREGVTPRNPESRARPRPKEQLPTLRGSQGAG